MYWRGEPPGSRLTDNIFRLSIRHRYILMPNGESAVSCRYLGSTEKQLQQPILCSKSSFSEKERTNEAVCGLRSLRPDSERLRSWHSRPIWRRLDLGRTGAPGFRCGLRPHFAHRISIAVSKCSRHLLSRSISVGNLISAGATVASIIRFPLLFF